MRTWLWVGLASVGAYACGGFTNTGFGGAGSGGAGGKGSASGTGSSSMAGGLADAVGTPAGSTVASTGSASSSGAQSSSSTGGGCNPDCGAFFKCCGSTCKNLQNDPFNCGNCGIKCEKAFCHTGKCDTPPCMGVACNPGICCGLTCCKAGQLCCEVQMGGPSQGPQCFDPVDGTCPKGNPGAVCAAPDTPIATPGGERPIAELRAGDLVYSVDRGRLVVVPIVAVQRNAVSQHRVVRVTLASGRVLRVSAPHPTADGRSFGALGAGDSLGGVAVVAAERVPYGEPFTYDVLPASDSGAYFAAGALIGSTMTRGAAVPEASWDLGR